MVFRGLHGLARYFDICVIYVVQSGRILRRIVNRYADQCRGCGYGHEDVEWCNNWHRWRAALGVATMAAGLWFLLRMSSEAGHELASNTHAQEYSYTRGYGPAAKQEQNVYRYQDMWAYSASRAEASRVTGVQALPGETKHELS